MILCPVGPYFASGFKPVSLLADPQYVRAWPGGCGDTKLGSNYAPTVFVQVRLRLHFHQHFLITWTHFFVRQSLFQKTAETAGLQQVLWLYGQDHQLTEVGTMNIFVFLTNHKGGKFLELQNLLAYLSILK